MQLSHKAQLNVLEQTHTNRERERESERETEWERDLTENWKDIIASTEIPS